jgi:hypothetical protein
MITSVSKIARASSIGPPGPNVTPGGKDTGISLQTDDIDAYHAQLKDRGVDVDAAA